MLDQEFNTPWTGTLSPDGLWRINGPWSGVNNVFMDPNLASFDGSHLNLTMTPSTNPLQGSEFQSVNGYSYGYYETSMKVSAVSGGVASFFLINAPDYKAPEFDIEFLLNQPNTVTFTTHSTTGASNTVYYNLGFDPSAAYHRYGISWTPGPTAGTATVTDFVDGQAVHTETGSGFLPSSAGDYIAMNTWSGLAGWGDGPPATNSTTSYDWVHFTPYTAPAPPPQHHGHSHHWLHEASAATPEPAEQFAMPWQHHDHWHWHI